MGVAKFQCRETSMKCTRNLLKFFHDICLQESLRGACDFSALGGGHHMGDCICFFFCTDEQLFK